MKKTTLSLLLLSSLISCSSITYKQSFDDQAHPIKSLVVLPIINKTTAADASNLYLSTLAEPLSNKGYYVYPMEITNEVFQKEGIVSGEQLSQVNPQKYRELFGADAALSVTIHEWDTSYLVVSSKIRVALEFTIISCRTGKVLWSQKKQKIILPNNHQPHRKSLGGLVGNLLSTALATAMTDYLSITRELNREILLVLPLGPYHRNYLNKPQELSNRQ